MELIMISQTKLKVMLSAEDMKKLDFDPCAGGDVSGRAAFRNILKEARDKCGFDAVGERVFVQYYPEKHGGCEMFVTKLTKDERYQTSAKKYFSGASSDLRNTGYIIYRFDKLADMLSFCTLLKKRGYTRESSFYVVEENVRRYYLLLGCEEVAAGEYGGVLMGRSAYHYIAEHGRRISLDAVNVLGEFG